METAVRIAIADDHAMVRQSFVRVLNAEKFFQVVLEANNGEVLLQPTVLMALIHKRFLQLTVMEMSC
jgi:DNA-binding NarL/FixJ family response regulator